LQSHKCSVNPYHWHGHSSTEASRFKASTCTATGAVGYCRTWQELAVLDFTRTRLCGGAHFIFRFRLSRLSYVELGSIWVRLDGEDLACLQSLCTQLCFTGFAYAALNTKFLPWGCTDSLHAGTERFCSGWLSKILLRSCEPGRILLWWPWCDCDMLGRARQCCNACNTADMQG
jgi:hypothetical protein